ncbi:aldose 1-epimerase [Tianweitania populi]|uniref:Aldose 1-epimerase n=1 Tax=Tianweitania populi TaxID=1607949 RepID=A0A8J3DSJ7_9HYPH|nr:aldose 1-epimerase [Tianweitania populi]GHD22089.1 aldose 1-epimerase [Tianweitania populi]
MTITLIAGGYRVVVDPAGGGVILSLDWQAKTGTWSALFAPADGSVPPFKAGCFTMLPFANRIKKGRFGFDGREIVLSVNLPDEGMAIHGFSREHPWRVASLNDAKLFLEQNFASVGNLYQYVAQQEIGLSEQGLRIGLSIRNTGEHTLPFGMGLHPWFVKTPRTTLSFGSSGAFERDEAGLPLPKRVETPIFRSEAPESLGELPYFDRFFPEWSPFLARICRPEEGLAITLEADGALRHLHVFVPDNRPVFCAEPVSHAPDVVNRPELGESNAMAVLQPGDTLSGAMTVRAENYLPS